MDEDVPFGFPIYNPMGQCHGKRGYRTKKQAKRAITFLEQKLHARLHSYRCYWCGSWHIGHKVKKSKEPLDKSDET